VCRAYHEYRLSGAMVFEPQITEVIDNMTSKGLIIVSICGQNVFVRVFMSLEYKHKHVSL